ncbi:hypothetical protein CBS147353_9000 [Aspergillus niger]|nr:hypothetical protein CBS147353_9000 [Aspergillus niger]
MAHNPPNDNQPRQKASAKRVKREPKSQHTNPQPQVFKPARHPKALPLKGGMAKMKKTAAARRRRKLFSQEYWDEQPKIHLTYSALMEFRHREGTIRWGNGRDETPALETSCKTVEDFAKRGGPDLTHLCDYQHRIYRDRSFDVPKLSMPAIYDKNLEGYLEHNGVEKRLGRDREPSNIEYLRQIMRQDRSDMDNMGQGARLNLTRLITQYKTRTNALRGIYLNLFGYESTETENHRGKALEGTITATKKYFYNLDPIVPHMISARPDLVDGADPKDLMGQVNEAEENDEKDEEPERKGKRGIGQGKDKANEKGKKREKQPTIHTILERYITPYHLLDDVQEDEEDPNKMILPNFFLYNLLKHNDQFAGARAALHSGALGARALRELEQYTKGNIPFDRRAHTFVAVLATTHMTIYAIHPISPPEREQREMDFQMTAIKAFRFDDSLDEGQLVERYKDGISALRNLREEAHRYRQMLIRQANGDYGGDDDDSNNEDSIESYDGDEDSEGDNIAGDGSDDGGDGRGQYDGNMEDGRDNPDSEPATKRKSEPNSGVGMMGSLFKRLRRR